MKTILDICLVCVIISGIFCTSIPVDIIPTLATEVVIPVTSTSVRLQMPYCYFENISSVCAIKTDCLVWAVASATSEKADFDVEYVAYPYQLAYAEGKYKMHSFVISTFDQFPCPAIAPYSIAIGTPSNCEELCDNVLPEGTNMSFKYLLTTSSFAVAHTEWSDSFLTKRRAEPDTIINHCLAERSGTMVVITTILSITIVLLVVLLLIAMIMVCRCETTK